MQKKEAWCDGHPVPGGLKSNASDRGAHEAQATSERSRWGLETSSLLLKRFEISRKYKTNQQMKEKKNVDKQESHRGGRGTQTILSGLAQVKRGGWADLGRQAHSGGLSLERLPW